MNPNKGLSIFSMVADAVRNPDTDAVRGLSDYLFDLEARVKALEKTNCYKNCLNHSVQPVLVIKGLPNE